LVDSGEGKKESSAVAASISFLIDAMDKATAEDVKETLTRKTKDLSQTVEIKEDIIKRLGTHLVSRIKSLGTADVAVEIGNNTDCCIQHCLWFCFDNLFLKYLVEVNFGGWRFVLVGNIVGRIYEVNQRRARLALGWLTVCRLVNRLGM